MLDWREGVVFHESFSGGGMTASRLEWFVLGDIDLKKRPELNGKFVQVLYQQRRLVALGNIETYPYHAHLADGLCEQLGLFGGDWEALPDLFRAPSGVKIAGGGWFRLEGKMLLLYGQSRAYGKFDPGWFNHAGIVDSIHGYEVVVGE